MYTYVPKIQGASPTIVINISDGKNIKEVELNQNDVVVGQTSGEWMALGTYNFLAGKKGFVEITNKNDNGIILADAVLLVPARN